MRLLIMSDTHVPLRARGLPDDLWRAVDATDVVIHAGDWASVALLDQLEAVKRVVGVIGNNDGPDLAARLPEVARVTLEGVRFAVVHDTGPARGREERCDQRFPDTDVVIFGHSHIPWDSRTPNGTRLLNPGSPTDRRRQPFHTYLTAIVEDGKFDQPRLHRL